MIIKKLWFKILYLVDLKKKEYRILQKKFQFIDRRFHINFFQKRFFQSKTSLLLIFGRLAVELICFLEQILKDRQRIFQQPN
jgi:hypothetical protein